MRFFVGLHQPSDCKHFGAAFVSVNRIAKRKGPFAVENWIMDSGAFTTISKHGGYPEPVELYAAQIKRWKGSMAWSFAARRSGRNANCWKEAKAWVERITSAPVQHVWNFL